MSRLIFGNPSRQVPDLQTSTRPTRLKYMLNLAPHLRLRSIVLSRKCIIPNGMSKSIEYHQLLLDIFFTLLGHRS